MVWECCNAKSLNMVVSQQLTPEQCFGSLGERERIGEFIFQLTYRLLKYGGMVVQGSTSSLVLQILPQAWFTLGKSSSRFRFKEGTYSKQHCPLLQCFGILGRTQQIEMYVNLYMNTSTPCPSWEIKPSGGWLMGTDMYIFTVYQ